MNYININQTGNHSLDFTSRALSGVDIDWTLTQEGNETPVASFTAQLSDSNYYQTLLIDSTLFTPKKDTFYILTGSIGSEDVYRGKVLATDGVVTPQAPISIHKDQYTENSTTNDYIILE